MDLNEKKNLREQKRLHHDGHIEGWLQSGLSQREYCERHGISLSTFSYWRRKHSRQRVPHPHFIELRPKEREDHPPTRIGEAECFHVLLPNRIAIQLPLDTSEAKMMNLVLALTRVPC